MATITFTRYFENPTGGDDTEEVQLPAKMEVCGRCKGVHDHAAFSNGISPEQFQEDPDFAEEYRRGDFDVTCTECKGRNVVAVVDRKRADPALLAEYDQGLQDEADFRAEVAAEVRMGA